MNQGQIVQIRQVDGVDHWIFAKVLDPNINLVEVTHPGNRDHGRHLTVSGADIRTKADVQALLSQAQTLVQNLSGGKLSNTQLNSLASADNFFAIFKETAHSVRRETLQNTLVQHYQEQLKKLT